MSIIGMELRWRAASAQLIAAVSAMAAELSGSRRAATRRRAEFLLRVEVVLCNLVAARVLGNPWLAVRRSNNAGKRSSVYGAQFVSLLDHLREHGFIEQCDWFYDDGSGARVPSTIRALPALWSRLPPALTLRDVKLVPVEPLELRTAKDDAGRYNRIAFEPTADTQRMSAEVARINEFLSRAAITWNGVTDFAFVTSNGRTPIARLVTWQHVGSLQRIFTRGSFDSFGRLEGGFWLNLPKHNRSKLRLDGEPLVSVDYRAMIPRLAYMQLGKTVDPADDLYAVSGLPREGVKRVLLAMLCARNRLSKYPRDTAEYFDGLSARDVFAAVEARHYAIRELFFTGAGDSLFKIESDLSVLNTLALQAKNVPALPLYDCLLVPASRAADTERQMLKAGLERGTFLPVSVSEPFL